MKMIFSFLMITLSCFVFGQDNYPVPPETENHLFYIQHSDNHNTYVYDANMDGNNLEKSDPIDEYRIVYTEGGVKKPLTQVQRMFAYGMKTQPLSSNLYKMELAAYSKMELYLTLDKNNKPKVYLTVNKRKIYLDKIFIQLKEGTRGFSVQIEYFLFFGKDFKTGKRVKEKLNMKTLD